MRYPSSTSIVVKPKQLRLVRRDDSCYWQAHYKVEGVKTWIRKTVDTDDPEKARARAERMWMKSTFDHEDGRPVVSRKFRRMANVVVLKMEQEVEAGTGIASLKEYLTAIRNYLIPFFGNHNVDAITPRLIAEFHVWRAERLGRELSASAQGTHNVALNRIFDEAIMRGYMAEIHRPALKNTYRCSRRYKGGIQS